MVGLANLVGTYIAGQSGRFVEKRRGLSLIYFGRCFVFLGLLFLPITPVTIIALSAVARPVLAVHGAAHLQPGGHVLRHPLDVDAVRRGLPVASARVVCRACGWRATLYDLTKSYDIMWWISIALGLFAAAVHWPIQERPVPRLAAANAA